MPRPVGAAISAFVLAALAACGAGPKGEAPTPAATLRLDRPSARPGDEVGLTVATTGDERLQGGVAYRLERWEDGRWQWVNRRQAFMARLVGVSRRQPYRQVVAVPEDAPPGRYRVVKRFTSRPGGRRFELTAELRIGG